MKNFARITGTGSYLPSKIITNFDLEKTLDTSDEWITSRTGIKERPIADISQTTSDLAFEAARLAIERSDIDINEIDLNQELDDNQDLKRALNISVLPHLLVTKNGKIVYRKTSYTPGSEDELYEIIQKYTN